MVKETGGIRTPSHVLVLGRDLSVAVYERVSALRNLQVALSADVKKKILEACKEDNDPVDKAVSLMCLLADGHSLSAHALGVKAILERSAAVQKDIRELTRFAKHVDVNSEYALTWDEADRFGL